MSTTRRLLLAALPLAIACTDPEIERVRHRAGTCSPVQSVKANGLDVEYDLRGPADGPPLLLVMGLGSQLTFWSEGFVQRLAEAGFRVIRFDNRDVGRSTHFESLGKGDVVGAAVAARAGWNVQAPYSLGDMADDAAGLLDALGVPSAHILGVSMGGMIVQELALRHPAKVRTLTSIMSTTGSHALPEPEQKALDAITARSSPKREATVANGLHLFEVIGSPGFPFDEADLRQRFETSYDRCWDPDGTSRQFVAVLGQRDRTESLKQLKIPALVIHGKADPLVPFPHGEATAKAIPGAQFLPIEGMGHDVPRGAWNTVVDAVKALADRSTVTAH